MTQSVLFNYIGEISSPYKEKFAIPRQPGLVTSAKGSITLLNDANTPEIVRGLEEFSHIWVLFVFHETQEQGWKPLVRPPRLGGNKKLGTLATRSTFRPNPIGMSVVKLDSIELKKSTINGINSKDVVLNISGLDLLDCTPVIDIKPYIPYSDAHIDAQAGYAGSAPNELLSISFSANAKSTLNKLAASYPELSTFISQVLMQDPRPAYKKDVIDEKIYGMSLYHLNIRWQFTSLSMINVLTIEEN